jgi:hypothetical protein
MANIDTLIVDPQTLRSHVLAMATMRRKSVVPTQNRDAAAVEGVCQGTTINGFIYGHESPDGINLKVVTDIAPTLERLN